MPKLFEYLDYRNYLKDRFRQEKSLNSKISYRFIGKFVGLDSGHLTKILNGSLHLSQEKISKMIDFLKLNRRESEYFEILVLYNKSKNASEIKTHLDKLLSFRELDPKVVGLEEYCFYQKWYHAAIYSLLDLGEGRSDPEGIAKIIRPKLSVDQVKESLALLQSLGYVEKKENGNYQPKQIHITTPKDWHSVAIQNYQIETIDLARQALDRVPKQHRNFMTLTMSLDDKAIEEVRDLTEEYRRKIMRVVEKCVKPDTVYQLNAQLFPLTPVGLKTEVKH